MARVKYTVGGREYEMRTFHQRDWAAVRSKLTLLPKEPLKGAPTDREVTIGLEGTARMLARCAIRPKLLVEYPETDPGEGFVALDDLSDAEIVELMTLLSKDSGYSVEAAEEIRPSSATPVAS